MIPTASVAARPRGGTHSVAATSRANRGMCGRWCSGLVSTMCLVTSPVQRIVGQVFIPVRDMSSAIEWYAELLGFDPGTSSHGGTIFDIPTDGETRLALDANRPDFDASGPPRFFLWTQDISATVRHLEGMGTKITSDVEDIGSVLFVQFEDPDGNPLMVCQRR